MFFLLRTSQAEDLPERPLRVIVVSSSGQAEEILRKLGRGVPFEELARAYSIDASAPQGGYLGNVSLSGLLPAVRDALQGIHAGQIAGPVDVSTGYMILKVLTEAERTEIETARRSSKLALAAAGQFRYPADVSGFAEVDGIIRRVSKPPGWEQDLRAICETRRRAITTGIQHFEGYLATAKLEPASERNVKGQMGAHHFLAQLWAYQGHMENAAEHFEAAYQLAVDSAPTEVQLDLLEKIGIAYLHRGEIENRMFEAPLRSCIFPIRSAAQLKSNASVETAMRHFVKYLERDPEDLEVEWLLNLGYMMLGKYPDAVPEQHLIPLGPFTSNEDVGLFLDVSGPAGLKTFDMAGGAIVDDFDNDGLLDVVTSGLDPCSPLHYFHNNGDGSLTERNSRAGLEGPLGGLNMVQADYDNNGCLDVLVLRGGWQYPMRKSLLRNNCDGTFTDVASESGVAIPATATQTAAWADIDNDGDLDLFVGNELASSQLFLNKGDKTFVEVGHTAGIDRVMYTKAVVAGDYDNDGYPDFYVSNFRGENFLYHNNRDRTFTNVARELGVEEPYVSFPAWFFDYDNDGWQDIVVFSYYPSSVEMVRSYLRLPVQAETLKLYRNTGNGSFQDVTQLVGLDRVFAPMGANFGDVDNDGFLDFYLGTGAPPFGTLLPNVLFRGKEGKTFVDITASSGTGCLHKGHGVAFADLDNDGDEDIVAQIGGAAPADSHATLLFRNPGNGNAWISIRLVGVKTNRAAIGARIRVTLQTAEGQRRSVHRVVSSGGSFGASPLQQHIGLGKARDIETLEIWWPTSNTRQIFRNVATNQSIEIREFEKTFSTLKRPSFQIGVKKGAAAGGLP